MSTTTEPVSTPLPTPPTEAAFASLRYFDALIASFKGAFNAGGDGIEVPEHEGPIVVNANRKTLDTLREEARRLLRAECAACGHEATSGANAALHVFFGTPTSADGIEQLMDAAIQNLQCLFAPEALTKMSYQDWYMYRTES